MAKKKAKPTVQDVLAYLEQHGEAEDWREVPGMRFGTVRQAVFESGKAALTPEGGLRLVDEDKKE